MELAYFSKTQVIHLLFSGGLLLASVFVFRRSLKLSLTLLVLGTFGLGLFMALCDPFLNLWDEQFHALVAKNLSADFLKPTLYAEPLLEYDYRDWTANHVWLHKQPLFLWQMALSIKVFGAKLWALRLPSILMHTLLPLMVYRVGRLCLNTEVGFLAALFFATANFPLELIVGKYSTDHNDLAFLFYVFASFWAWFEYQKSRRSYWLVLIGFFAGGAVLVKWLMGTLVYVIWLLIESLQARQKGFAVSSFLPLLYSGLVCLLVFLPWQIYIHVEFPLEASHEMNLNSRHFFEAVENHSESFWFHFTSGFRTIYGSGALIPFIFWGALIWFLVKCFNKTFSIFMLLSVLFVYGFYTLATTKMVSFPLIVAPFFYLGLACLIKSIFDFVQSKFRQTVMHSVFYGLVAFSLTFILLDLPKIQHKHTNWKPNDNESRISKIAEREWIDALNERIQGKKYVLFNANRTPYQYVPIMFYTDVVAYPQVPSKKEMIQLKNSGYSIAIVDDGHLPDYIIEDREVKLIREGSNQIEALFNSKVNTKK